jgi:hypothetical protein
MLIAKGLKVNKACSSPKFLMTPVSANFRSQASFKLRTRRTLR